MNCCQIITCIKKALSSTTMNCDNTEVLDAITAQTLTLSNLIVTIGVTIEQVINAQTETILDAIQACCAKNCDNWMANKKYIVGDCVRQGNDFYNCIKDNLSSGANKPPNIAFWEEV